MRLSKQKGARNAQNRPTLEFLRIVEKLTRRTKQPVLGTWLSTWVLKHGRRFDVRSDWPDSVPLRRGAARECFATAAKAALKNPRFVYCEGMATGIIPTEHAWVYDLETGVAYDPTWDHGEDYIGVPFATDALRRALLENGVYGVLNTMGESPVWNEPVDSWRHPGVPHQTNLS